VGSGREIRSKRLIASCVVELSRATSCAFSTRHGAAWQRRLGGPYPVDRGSARPSRATAPKWTKASPQKGSQMKIDDVARAMEDILAVAGPDETVANEAFEKLQKRVGLELGLSGQALTNVMTEAFMLSVRRIADQGIATSEFRQFGALGKEAH
jgi:hypothetical protein